MAPCVFSRLENFCDLRKRIGSTHRPLATSETLEIAARYRIDAGI